MSGQLETQQRRSRRGAVAAVLACVVAAAAFVSGCTTDADESARTRLRSRSVSAELRALVADTVREAREHGRLLTTLPPLSH